MRAIPWVIPAVLFAATAAVVGVIWDISWHRTIGRDAFLTPAHLAIYLSGIVAGLACGFVVLRTTVAGTPDEKAAGVRFWGYRGPLGARRPNYGSQQPHVACRPPRRIRVSLRLPAAGVLSHLGASKSGRTSVDRQLAANVT